MLWGAITTALLFGAYRFIGNVLDYAGDTREDFMREYAEADSAFVARELAAGSNIYRATGGWSLKRQQPTAKGTLTIRHGIALHVGKAL